MLNNREIYLANLPHRAVSVYMYLCDRADADGKCFPSVRTICEDLNMSERTVYRALEDLLSSGIMKKEPRYRFNGGRSSSVYFV